MPSPNNISHQRIGIGLREPHYSAFLEQQPNLALVEMHSENHFAAGGPSRDIVHQIGDIAPLSLHGVGLSLGSADGIDARHLQTLTTLVNELNPILISEHISWGKSGAIHTHDLLPLPYCPEVIQLLSQHIDQVQQALGREILIENISTYVSLEQSTMPEWEFIAQLIEQAQCGLLLDINNMYVNSHNHQFDMSDYMAAVPWQQVKEIHVAGHIQEGHLLVDTHSEPVCENVRHWLNQTATQTHTDTPVLLEWDADLPSFDQLLQHAFNLSDVHTPNAYKSKEASHAVA